MRTRGSLVHIWAVLALAMGLCTASGAAWAQAEAAPGAPAALRLAGLFSDHMVLQHGAPLRVWGQAQAGDRVTVRFRGESRRTTTDANGRWSVTLKSAPPGGPHTLRVQGRQTHVLSDIQVGEVWLCAGQSNMEWSLAQSAGGERAVAQASQPLIRHVKLPHRALLAPTDDTPSLTWQVASPATAGGFTGVGYFFARQRQAQRRMAIGLVNVAWGGTHLETWSRGASLATDADWAPWVANQPRTLAEWAAVQSDRSRATLASFQPGLPGTDTAQARDWALPDQSDAAWPTLQVPRIWETQGLPGFDGVVWLRKDITLDAAQAAAPANLQLGAIDDCDETWVNGQRVGGLCAWDQPRHYALPAGTLQAGRNVIAVRVTDTGGGGGFHGEAAAVRLVVGSQALALAGPWKARIEAALPKPEPHANDGVQRHGAAAATASSAGGSLVPGRKQCAARSPLRAGLSAPDQRLAPALGSTGIAFPLRATGGLPAAGQEHLGRQHLGRTSGCPASSTATAPYRHGGGHRRGRCQRHPPAQQAGGG